MGLGLGERDTREHYYDILRICKIKKPNHILLENVKGLYQKRHEATLNNIIRSLQRQYAVELLNSKDYGMQYRRGYSYKGTLPLFLI